MDFYIKNKWAFGDGVCLTALVRDLSTAYPQHRIYTGGHYSRVLWCNSPHVTGVLGVDTKSLPKGTVTVPLEYGSGIKYAGRGNHVHFSSWFHRSFHQHTGLSVPMKKPHGDLHLSDAEKVSWFNGRYWVIVAGGKSDFTTKWWAPARWQKLVYLLKDRGIHCVQVGTKFSGQYHFKLDGVTSLIGATDNIRDLFTIIHNSDGVICGITGAMHAAAALQKPCVVVAGGREEPWWEAYVNNYNAFGPDCEPLQVEHKYLHTISLLECCPTKGCWRDKIVPSNDTAEARKSLCKLPVVCEGVTVPKCLEMIQAEHVLGAVMEYYKNHLPPIQPIDSLEPNRPIPQVEPRPLPQTIQVAPSPQTLGQLDALMNHPTIGGKITIFVLCYGNNFNLAHKCLSGILRTVPNKYLDLRVGLNECCQQTIDYVAGLPTQVVHVFNTNKFKYPAMRIMLHDQDPPINTKYMIWFDDDSFVRTDNWLVESLQCIVNHHDAGNRLFGTVYFNTLQSENSKNWFRQATWYQGRDMLVSMKSSTRAPNGATIRFVAGYYWMMATEMIEKAQIPDVRLRNNGGDICIGEQINQAGYFVKNFNQHKKFILGSSAPRRGASHVFPWLE